MPADKYPSRHSAADAETRATLIDLLVAQVDRAYVTAGQPGALAAVRDLFSRMEPAAVKALVYQLGLAAEPVREAEPENRRE